MFKIFITKKEQAVNDFHHILILFSSEVKEITDQAPVQVHHYKQTVLMWVRFFFYWKFIYFMSACQLVLVFSDSYCEKYCA